MVYICLVLCMNLVKAHLKISMQLYIMIDLLPPKEIRMQYVNSGIFISMAKELNKTTQ